MVTIKDIAERAGVSYGTVSNVMNNKGNVSSDKIRKVLEVAKELGYSMNKQAAMLKRGSRKLISVFVYEHEFNRYRTFYEGLLYAARSYNYDVTLVEIELAEQLTKNINKELQRNPEFIVLAGIFPDRKDIRDIAKTVPVHVYNQYLTFKTKNVTFWAYDPIKVANDLVSKVYELHSSKKVFIFTSEERANSSMLTQNLVTDLDEYFVKVMNLNRTNQTQTLLEVASSLGINDIIIFPDLSVLNEFSKILEWYEIDHRKLHLITFSEVESFHLKNIHYYEFNYKRDGQLLIDEIIGKHDYESNNILKEEGFFKDNFVNRNIPTKKLKIALLHSPTSKIIQQLARKFTTQTGVNLEIDEYKYEELHNLIMNPERKDELEKYDIYRVDAAWLNSLPANVFHSLEKEERANKILNSLENLPSNFSSINGKFSVIPFDASVQLLFYRKDIFNNALVKREFFEQKGRELRVPDTYIEFDEVSRFLTRYAEENQDVGFFYGTSFIDKNPYVLAPMLLPRINEKIDLQSISSQKAIDESIEDYKNTIEFTQHSGSDFWTHLAQNFANGETVMEILFSNFASNILLKTKSFSSSDIGYASVPQKHSLLGGGSFGILSTTKEYEGALLFLEWLYSREITHLINISGGVIHKKDVASTLEVVKAYPWISKVDYYFDLATRTKLGDELIAHEKELEIGEYIENKLLEDN